MQRYALRMEYGRVVRGGSGRISVMNAPKQSTCHATAQNIEQGEVALTFSTAGRSKNPWFKLSELGEVVDALETISDSEKYPTNDHGGPITGHQYDCQIKEDITVETFSPAQVRGACLACDEEVKIYSEPDVLAVNFSWANKADPWIHVDCAPDLAEGLAMFFESDARGELMSRVL